MITRYPTIANILENEFSYEMEVNRDEGVSFLLNGINEGLYDFDTLKKEYDNAIADSEMNWVEFAIRTKMFWDKDSYSNKDIINYLKYFLHEVIYPEDKMSATKFDFFICNALQLLISVENNSGWIELEKLYNKIIKIDGLNSLPFYNMYCLMINNDYKIKGKSEKGKGKERILIKHNQWK